jgi:3-hydroxymyristoyl/3-hydroxydecanoyl-(acyl carrier protein) dehydratase
MNGAVMSMRDSSRFLYVSKINSIRGTSITGSVSFSETEPFQSQDVGLPRPKVRVSVISEAIGQLVSWLSLSRTDFKGRPVFLFARQIHLRDIVPVGETVALEAHILKEADDSFLFSGTALWNGQLVARIDECGGYLMPLQDLEDEGATRKRFETLATKGFAANEGFGVVDPQNFIDATAINFMERHITATKRFNGDEPFYADHFPRFPVTPIVVINEMIAEATQRLLQAINPHLMVVPYCVNDLKIKSFIRPGDQVQIHVEFIEMGQGQLATIADITLNQKRILRGRYRYQLATKETSFDHYNRHHQNFHVHQEIRGVL